MPSVETNTRKIVTRLRGEGRIAAAGGKQFEHPDRPGGVLLMARCPACPRSC